MTPRNCIIILICFFFSCSNEPGQIDKSESNIPTYKDTNQKSTDTVLLHTWTAFKEAVKSGDRKALRQLSLDSLQCSDTTVLASTFLKYCFDEVFDSTLIRKMDVAEDIHFMNRSTYTWGFSKKVLKIAVYTGDVIDLKEIAIQKAPTIEGGYWQVAFDFIKTNKGYKLYSYNSAGGPVCCR